MDKNKNRTDLLAAGRKKLQQFRKKKDTKGKSSHKTSKSEHEGDAELEASPVDPPASPKVAEEETALPCGADVELSDSTEKSAPIESESVNIVHSDPPQPVLVQDDVSEPVAIVKGEAVGADAQSGVDSSVPEDLGNAKGGSTRTVEDGEVDGSSIGASAESVVVREEPIHAAELASVDSLASPSTISRDNQDEEKLSSPLQELLCDMSSSKERENQEADSLGSYQCDGRDKEIYGSLQDGESLGVGYIRLEPEEDQESAVSNHREISKDFAGASHDLEGTQKTPHEAGAINGDGVSVISSNYKVEATPDAADISVSADATDDTEGTPKFDKGNEGSNYQTEGTDEMDGVTNYGDESHNVGLSLSSEAISREEGTLHMDPEETTHRTEVTQEGTHDTGDGSALAVTNHEKEGTVDADGEEKPEIHHEGAGANSSPEKEIEIMPFSNDLGSECKAGIQADMEWNPSRYGVDGLYKQQMPPVETVIVSNRQENSLKENMVLNGSQSISRCTDVGYVDLNQLAKVIQGLDEEEVMHLLKVRPLTSKPESEKLGIPEKGLGDVVESLKKQLYLTIVAKDVFQLQLSEQTELQMECDQRDNQFLNEVSKLNSILKETRDCNTNLSVELAQCRSDLHAMAAGKEELETQFSGAREELAQCRFDLQAMVAGREELQTQFTGAREELAQCRSDLQAMVAGREEFETQFTGAREELAQCRSDLHAMVAGREELEIQFTGAREELAQCRFDLQAMASAREELETQFANAREEIGEITTRSFELQTQLERSHEKMENLLAELAGFRGSMETLETENSNLHENLTEVRGEKKKLEEENTFFLHENQRLAAQLLERQEHASREHDKHTQLEVDLKEAMLRLEQLTQENIFLFSSLDVHKAKLTEIKSQHFQLLSQDTGGRDHLEDLNAPMMHPADDEYSHQSPQHVVGKVVSGEGESVTLNLTEGISLRALEGELFNEFPDLKAHFDEADKTMQKLEKAIEGMHSHSVSLSKSGGKGAGAGVSKLIQAFELKVHHEENVPVELPLDEGERSTDNRFTLAKEQTSNLRAILKRLDMGALKVHAEFKEEKSNRKLASVALSELQILYEASKQQTNNLEARISELVSKMSDYQSSTDEMHLKLYKMQQKSDEMEAVFFNQLENLQLDMGDKVSILEQEWNCTVAEISETVENLNAFIGRLHTTTYSAVQSDDLSFGRRVAASIDAATKMMEDLHEKLGAAYTDLTKMHGSYESLSEKFSDLLVRNGLAVEIMGMIYNELTKLTAGSCEDSQRSGTVDVKDENLFDLLHPSNYIYLLNRLSELLGERLLLKSAKAELEAESINRRQEVTELKKKFIDPNSILKLVEDVKFVVELNDMEIDSDKPFISLLESLIASLVQKYREVSEQVSSCKEEFGLKVMECSELQVMMQQLSSLSSQQEDETHILKKSLREVDGTLEALRSDLQAKGAELEQSEQRVLSVREKLSIAVAKGKGLIVQRDNLKHSLSEMSSELERCSQEVHLKDTRLREVETKLKAYSEAGERIEALESELSYIRNSATALRESFLLKDSVLQRIEEVLEELELPENFHSRDIIEKIEWLVRSVSGNSLPTTDWDQKSSVGRGSYSDAGFVAMDGWKEVIHPVSNPGLEDMKRKNDELQSKFYGLAEQNEMLEQSLMERNKLVQRWEEALDRMDMPSQLRSMETEERIGWLGSALFEARHDRDFLLKKIENFESHCGSLTADLEQSQRKISDLDLALQGVTRERELLSESLENLSRDQTKGVEKVTKYELEKCNLQDEIASLQEQLVKKLENDDHFHHVKDEIKRLQVLVSDALQDQSADNIARGGSDTECLEGLLRKLIENYMALSFEKSVLKDVVKEHHAVESDVVREESNNDIALKSKEQDQVIMKEEFEDALSKLAHVKAEREKIVESYQSLVVDFEALGRQRDELQEKLYQEETKLVSTRDKLNVAVRKGKGLVQQRDSLKQTIEEMKSDKDHLKDELNQRESALVQYQQKFRDLSTYPEKVETLESECLFLRSRLTEMENSLQDSGDTLSSWKSTLNAIDIGSDLNTIDPIKKMETIGKLWDDLQAALASSEHESKKSKRATELLLAELNEVHERADGLQEELSKVEAAIAGISKERDLAEAARTETLSRLENVITVHSEERKKELAEAIKLKAVIDQLKKGCFGFTNLLADVFSVELELLSNVEDGMESLLKQMDSTDVVNLPLLVASGGVFSANSANEVKFCATDISLEMKIEDNFDDYSIIDVFGIVGHTLQECAREVNTLREKCYKHSVSCDHQAKRMSKAMEAVYKEIASQKESLESKKRDFMHFEVMKTEKDNEILVMRRMIALLYKACTGSILEIENQNAQTVRYGVHVYENKGLDQKLPRFFVGQESVDGQASFTEEIINNLAETLLLAVKDSVSMQAETVKHSQKELTAAISNLQKELQENDIQKNRICAELVSQIKKVEADAKNYLVDLQSANSQVENLEKRIEALEKERKVLELKIKDLHDGETLSMQLQDKIVSLTDLLSAKGQEIEDLMQALDEEELQMEGLRSKIEELEKISLQKDLALKNLEASRGKAMSKLSITVSKFDELHQLSESLLSEVENLQSQLQGRDAEISFLRQEVTRCTNDVLAASQENNKRNSSEMHDLLTWLDIMISRFGGYDSDIQLDDKGGSRMEACKETLEKQITSLLSELEALRVMAQNKDALLQIEKTRTEELSQKSDSLERFFREKELKMASLQGSRDLGETTSIASLEITEVEPMINKRAVAGSSVTPHVRSMRKVNNDQVAISIDTDPDGRTLDDEDEKVHGFKSLTTSRVVPRFTRPVSDMIDGLWVSCDRALMRQPALRLGIIIYWFMLHTLLATLMV